MTHQIPLETLELRICLSAGTNFGTVIDNPLFPLIPGTTYIYRGSDEDGNSLRTRTLVTDQTKTVQGVATRVVRDRDYVNGELVEDTRDFYAQDEDGNVWYFGELAQQIENGQVVGTEGSWRAGVNGARGGIIMPAHPRAGDSFAQENAPGIAQDHADVESLSSRANAPFGTFSALVRTRETSVLEPDAAEQKFYAPGIGLIKSQDVAAGGEVTRLAYIQLAPQAFSSTIDNPYFPLTPGTTLIYRGEKDGASSRDRFEITHRTKQLMGVTTVEVHDRGYEDGVLAEDTLDWFAQDKLGNVWYFGEDTKELDEDGNITSTEGSWQAGVNGALPGIVMLAFPGVGSAYHQEFAVGVAEDQARVIGRGIEARTPFAEMDTLQTEEFTPLEPDVREQKFYAPGVGFVMSITTRGGDEVLRLAYVLTEA